MERKPERRGGARCVPVNLSRHFNWPPRKPDRSPLRQIASRVGRYPAGAQSPWGIPFTLGGPQGPRVIVAARDRPEVTIRLNGRADYLCFIHAWEQLPGTIQTGIPREGIRVGEYVLAYADGARHAQPVRGRFEVSMAESPGPPWLAVPYSMPTAIDPAKATAETNWGLAQTGLLYGHGILLWQPFIYALKNPRAGARIASLTIRGFQESPLVVAGLTLYRGKSHPLRHLPRRTFRVRVPGRAPPRISEATVDLGRVTRIEKTGGPRDRRWLASPYAGAAGSVEPARGGEDLVELVAADDATLSVRLGEKKKSLRFSVGEAFHRGQSRSGRAALEVLGQRRQWMQVRVVDQSTGRPTPVRIHFSGRRGEYLAPYGHHAQINTNWFEDYGADVVVGGRSYAYVPGEFTTDLPVGEVFVEICKGFEYEPVRRKITVRPGQKTLDLNIARWRDLRQKGWVTADTHVHFISPQTAWLEGQCEGVNVVNLLASQWGRLFTNVGDLRGRVGVAEDDTLVYVGTENRHHMLGHMSMLGTRGMPVYPMCCGGSSEAWIGDPEFRSLAEWARENRRKGGVVIRPHFPSCGFTEDPVPILAGLVDALEIRGLRGTDFSAQEWYRYLNCGCRVAVVGGTDKMGASTALGWLRTYARINPDRPFTYAAWARAVRQGRTIATTGPLMDLTVDGREIGATIEMPAGGGTVEAQAAAESAWPLGRLEIVANGRVVASREASEGARSLRLRERVRFSGSGWVAARCSGHAHPAVAYAAAHTSPVYVRCGSARLFDGPAAEHMLALVEGGIEYLNTFATVFDAAAQRRMTRLFRETQEKLRNRLRRERT